MAAQTFEELFDAAHGRGSFWLEKAKLEFTVDLRRIMKDKGISEADLMRSLGATPGYVTRVLTGSDNLTLATMVRVARAVGGTLRIGVSDE